MKKRMKKLKQKRRVALTILISIVSLGVSCYFIHNASAKESIAKEISFDSSSTNLTATNAQDAVEQLYNLGKNGTLNSTSSYLVQFECNGCTATTEPSSQNVSSGSKATKPADPTKENNTFGGWYSDSSLSTAYDFNTAVTANLTLYAKWTENSSSGGNETTNYTVTFNSNGGSSVTSQTVTSGSAATKPADPTKSNNTFGGWYTDQGLTIAYNFSVPVTSNITLYAKWIENNATITENNGSTSLSKNDVLVSIPTTTANDKNIKDFSYQGVSDTEKQRIINIIPNATDAYGFIVKVKDNNDKDADVSNTQIKYTIPMPSGFSQNDNLELYKINGNNKEKIPFTIENGKIVFTATGDGEFAIVKIKSNGSSEKATITDDEDGTTTIKKDGTEIVMKTEDSNKKNVDDVSIENLTDDEKNNVNKLISGATDIAGVKIELKDKDGKTVDVSDTELTYKIPLPNGFDVNDNLKLYRIDGNNKEEIPFTIENGKIVFKTNKSGQFVIAKFPGVPSQILKTGQKIVRYGAIISILLGLIIIGIIINKGKKKK